MAVFTEVFPASDADVARGNDPSQDSDYYQPRIAEIDGRWYRVTQHELDQVAAGKARFEGRDKIGYRGNPGAYYVAHEGTTLTSRERNYYDDSDFYALYWDADAGTIGTTTYATTRGGGTDDNYVTVDPTPEVLDAVRAWQAQQNYDALRAAELRDWTAAADAVVDPARKGQRVKIVKGRKVPIGTEGTVFWVGQERTYRPVYRNGYNQPEDAARIGLKDAAGEVFWTAAANAEAIVDPDDIPALSDFRKPEADVRGLAAYMATQKWTDRGARIPASII
jgi:hypothetical protein